MDIFGFNLNLEWIGYVAGFLVFLPFGTTLFDKITQLISDVMVRLNLEIVDKIPLPPIKDWLQKRQVNMLRSSITQYQKAINKINQK